MDTFHDIDSWIKFGVFMAATFWVAAIGVGSFWLKRVITRAESERDLAEKKHQKARAHTAHGHSSHGPNGAERSEVK